MLRILAGSRGRIAFSFLSSTMLFSSSCWAISSPPEHIDDTFLHGMVHNAGHELCVKNPARMVINFSHRHLAVFYCLQ